jgi:ligand-binding SRPBCC domain-containing protein
MKSHCLTHVTTIAKPIEDVFDFFSKAENLNELTPPELDFEIITPLPVNMQKGSLLDYRIKLNGIRFNWKTEISAWEPPYRFVDKQLKGPYVLWIHEHRFKALNNHLTEMTDTVHYLSPGWLLEPLVHHLFVKKKVEATFKFRKEMLKKIFDN